MEVKEAFYTTRPDKSNLNGTFFYTSCCNKRLYSIKDKYAYDGALCPACMYKHKKVVLRLAEKERKS